jgi:hypothetical protein
MSYCAYCRNPFPEGAAVCSKCKAPVPPTIQNPENESAGFSSTPKKRLLVAGASLLSLVLVSVAANLAMNIKASDAVGGVSNQAPAAEIRVDDGLVPDFVGFDAYQAFMLSKRLGFSAELYSLDGEYIHDSDVDFAESLTSKAICYQGLLPGLSFSTYAKLKLVIDSSCAGNKSKMLSGIYAAKANIWAPALTSGASALENEVLEGWVAGYGDEYSPESITLLTNYGEVTLALGLIQPISNWCQDDAFPGQNQDLLALQAVKDTAPLYNPLRVVFGESARYDETFMHRLDSSGNLLDGQEPENSINELLVKTGYWIPDSVGIEESELKIDPIKRKWKISKNSFFEPIQLTYAQRLVAAANALRLDVGNPLGVCVAAEKAYWDIFYKDYYADLDANGSSGGVSGTGGGCYVRGHYRAGHWVNGYYRNC